MDILTLLSEVITGLIAASIGFLVGKSWGFINQKIVLSVGKWFWFPSKGEKIYIYIGERSGLLPERELEPLVGLEDARGVIKLIDLLSNYYTEIIVATKETMMDWSYPVICIRGPLANSLTRKMEVREHWPIRFLDTPYSKDSKRAIGSGERAQVFSPSFDIDGDLITDIAYIVRINSPYNPNSTMFVFAGCYGKGTYGAIDYSLSVKNLRTIKNICRSGIFQLVIKSHISETKISKTELVYHVELN